MKDLPGNLTPGQCTPEFTELSVPEGLIKSHATRPGTWGKIIVLEGSLTYRILEPEIEELELDSDRSGVIEPTIRHQVEPHAGVRFFIQFYNREGA